MASKFILINTWTQLPHYGIEMGIEMHFLYQIVYHFISKFISIIPQTHYIQIDSTPLYWSCVEIHSYISKFLLFLTFFIGWVLVKDLNFEITKDLICHRKLMCDEWSKHTTPKRSNSIPHTNITKWRGWP